MKCSLCEGRLRKERITYSEIRNGKVFLFESTPVFVCETCGDTSFSVKVMAAIDRVIKEKRQPKEIRKIPVYSLAQISTEV